MNSTKHFHFSLVLFLGVISIVTIANSCFAGSGWGSVDSRLLLILHPNMANFDYSSGKFFRPGANTKKPEVLQQELNAAWAKIQPAIKSLAMKQSRVINARTEMLTRRDESINSMLAKAAGSKDQIRDRDKLMNDFEARYAADMENFSRQLEEIDHQMKSVQDEAYSPVYLTDSESEKFLLSTRTEIEDLIKQTANESGIGVVVDSSLGTRPIKKAELMCNIPSQQDSSDLLSSTLFHYFSNYDSESFNRSDTKGRTFNLLSHVGPVLNQNMVQNIRQYMEYRPYLAESVAGFSPGKIFMVGGQDITPLVARKIFARYRIPSELQNAFMYVIRDYSSYEQPQVQSIIPSGSQYPARNPQSAPNK